MNPAPESRPDGAVWGMEFAPPRTGTRGVAREAHDIVVEHPTPPFVYSPDPGVDS